MQALEEKFRDQIRLCDGPALSEGGFFYEMFLEDGLTVSESDFDDLGKRIKAIVKQRQPFERLQVTREFADELFAYSEFKRDMLHKIPEGEAISLYRCGPLIDLCRGPHVPHTGTLSLDQVYGDAAVCPVCFADAERATRDDERCHLVRCSLTKARCAPRVGLASNSDHYCLSNDSVLYH